LTTPTLFEKHSEWPRIDAIVKSLHRLSDDEIRQAKFDDLKVTINQISANLEKYAVETQLALKALAWGVPIDSAFTKISMTSESSATDKRVFDAMTVLLNFFSTVEYV
jgi:hypothetical protein